MKSLPVSEINPQLLGVITNAAEQKIRDWRVVLESYKPHCLLQRKRNRHDSHRLP